MTLPVPGATNIKSARSVRPMCWGSLVSIKSNVSVRTLRPERASKVRGVMNFWASAVITTETPAPVWTSLLTTSATLYAAIPPQTATMISRPFRVSLISADIKAMLTATTPRRHERQSSFGLSFVAPWRRGGCLSVFLFRRRQSARLVIDGDLVLEDLLDHRLQVRPVRVALDQGAGAVHQFDHPLLNQ